MAGWASANKYPCSVLRAARPAAVLRELPLVLAVASVRSPPPALPQRHRTGVAAVVAALAGAGRPGLPGRRGRRAAAPAFDMVADVEIVFGAYTEYTGLRFAFFLLAEYAGIVVMALLAVLYLGGWQGPSPTSSAGSGPC